MSLIVQKFGGSSLADAEKLMRAAQIVKAERDAGNDAVVVVSAQGDTTDRLIEKAEQVCAQPPARELDALLACGEQASAALMAMALAAIGVPAVSLSAWQVPIHADGVHGDARIERVGAARTERERKAGHAAVITGFQAVDDTEDTVTLGRGGSDYTAVALAAALHADACRIYTDVDGIYTADPRLCPSAHRLDCVSYDDMYALARAGAQVLHDKCVALAQEKGVEPVVLSCVEGSAGTRIGSCAGARVAGVTCRTLPDGVFAAVTMVGRALPSLETEKDAILALDAARIPIRDIDAAERSMTLYVPRVDATRAMCAVHNAVIR